MSIAPHNLIVIVSDEHDARYMGASGHPFVQTPNLDRLAARGRRFASASTPSPICVPARAAMATGLYSHQTGYWDNAMAYDGAVAGWGHALQRSGIRVESIGKLHYRGADWPTGFDRQHMPMHISAGKGMIWGSIRDPLPLIPHRDRPRMIGEYVGPGESDYSRFDSAVTEQTVNWLEDAAAKPDEKPWVLFVGLVSPHFPLIAPPEFAALYPGELVPEPKLRPETGYRRHPWVQIMHDYWPHDDGFHGDQERTTALRMYFALCSFLDHNVGRILESLDSTGLSATTRVIYASDHGDNLGSRGMWGKSTLYQESVAVPLIIAGPDVTPGVERTPVSLVDLHPTILEAVGVRAGDGIERPGASLLSQGPLDPDRVVLSEYHAVGAASGAFMVRKGRWKYHHYVGFRPELFDLEADPEELNDLASNPAFRDVVEDLRGELEAICDPEVVDAEAKADQARLIAAHGGREAALNLGHLGATPAPDLAES